MQREKFYLQLYKFKIGGYSFYATDIKLRDYTLTVWFASPLIQVSAFNIGGNNQKIEIGKQRLIASSIPKISALIERRKQRVARILNKIMLNQRELLS